ncbi:MFS transporter [Streptomyces brevispora]|uniref:MFS transporter n=1 Tax=Streptomyces brevispora TaxID=887462 RepID=A0A561V675_9ACTN|nr:MFS transporter [Streptomyces brevispora]
MCRRSCALTNLAAGTLTARFRRKQLLVAGWLIGIPVPFALAWAPSWGWVLAANVLLGLNQGLTWSMTVNMKIDLVGPARRGLATGLNEAAGYTAVGATALLTGYLATSYGLRPVPELIGIVFVAGLALALVVRDTAAHVALELSQHAAPLPTGEKRGLAATFTRTSWRDRSLRGASQAGLVNNLNDGLTWGVFPLLFVIAAALLTAASGILAARWITDAPNHWTSADDVETVAAATPASPRVLAGECRCGGNRRHEKPRSASFADPGCSRDGVGSVVAVGGVGGSAEKPCNSAERQGHDGGNGPADGSDYVRDRLQHVMLPPSRCRCGADESQPGCRVAIFTEEHHEGQRQPHKLFRHRPMGHSRAASRSSEPRE